MSGTVQTPGNPLVDQGSLNRLRATITIPNFPQLNVTPSYLGEAGVALSLEGVTTTYLATLTGGVTSPEPYQMATADVNLVKSQNLAALYKAQMENDARIGDLTVRPDATTLPDYQLRNCAIVRVRPFTFNGKDAGFVVTLQGYYLINNSLWNV